MSSISLFSRLDVLHYLVALGRRLNHGGAASSALVGTFKSEALSIHRDVIPPSVPRFFVKKRVSRVSIVSLLSAPRLPLLIRIKGALPSDFIRYVKSYYPESSEGVGDANGESTISRHKASPNIDRPFLERVWKWLTKNPEIRVGEHAGHKRLTLSEVETRNAAIEYLEPPSTASGQKQQGQANAASQALMEVANHQDAHTAQTREAATSASDHAVIQTVQHAPAPGVPEVDKPPTASQAFAKSPDNGKDGDIPQAGAAGQVAIAPAKTLTALPKSTFQPGIRLYTSKNRMWYALTGHGPNLSRVKALDFIALSIIAACGPTGILQNDLTRISGQDKRSLPARTDRLHEGGYIVKERLMTDDGTGQRMIHTSRCTLTRYVKATASQAERSETPSTKKNKKRRKATDSGAGGQHDAAPNHSSLSAARTDSHKRSSQSETRPVPQWTADRPVSNQVFDLVDQSGIQGISMNVSLPHSFAMSPLTFSTGNSRSSIWWSCQKSH